MKDFLLVFLGGDPNWATNATPDEIQAVMGAWGQWFQELEKSNSLRNPGAGLTSVGSLVTTGGADVSTDSTMGEVKELVGGYSVIQAASLEAANELASGSPFLKNNPQGTILVRECFSPEGM